MGPKSTIAIVGTGYVGLTCAIGLAELGHNVVGYDILPDRVRGLNHGIPPYHENGLSEALRTHLDGGRLRFVEHLAEAVRNAEFIVIAVGTPSRADGSCDLTALEDATTALLQLPMRYPTVILRSTVPPGTTLRLARRLEGFAQVVFAPEFLREGNALGDFLNPDRIVVGGESVDANKRVIALFAQHGEPALSTSSTNAELVKGFSNAFLAMKISFANEVANVCDAFDDTDALHVLRGIGLDRRIGEAFLAPGIGFGGPCFEKDVKSLIHVSSRVRAGGNLLNATLAVNVEQPRRIVNKLETELGSLAGTHIGVWGLTFKAGTDDVRDSLAVRIVDDLLARGASVAAYDPTVPDIRREGLTMATSALDAADADALLILTEWPHFKEVDIDAIASRVRRGVVVDGRNILHPASIAAAGLRYHGVGRRALLHLDPSLAAAS